MMPIGLSAFVQWGKRKLILLLLVVMWLFMWISLWIFGGGFIFWISLGFYFLSSSWIFLPLWPHCEHYDDVLADDKQCVYNLLCDLIAKDDFPFG